MGLKSDRFDAGTLVDLRLPRIALHWKESSLGLTHRAPWRSPKRPPYVRRAQVSRGCHSARSITPSSHRRETTLLTSFRWSCRAGRSTAGLAARFNVPISAPGEIAFQAFVADEKDRTRVQADLMHRRKRDFLFLSLHCGDTGHAFLLTNYHSCVGHSSHPLSRREPQGRDGRSTARRYPVHWRRCFLVFLVALARVQDLLLYAKHLLGGARAQGARGAGSKIRIARSPADKPSRTLKCAARVRRRRGRAPGLRDVRSPRRHASRRHICDADRTD